MMKIGDLSIGFIKANVKNQQRENAGIGRLSHNNLEDDARSEMRRSNCSH